MNHSLAWILAAACLAGCGPADGRAAAEEPPVAEAPSPMDADSICRVVEAGVPLPDAVRETSGLARSLRDPELFWTHNDAGNGAELFALDGGGRLVGRVRVAGNPVKFRGASEPPYRYPPTLGGDSRAVMRDLLGLDEGRYEAFRKAGIIREAGDGKG